MSDQITYRQLSRAEISVLQQINRVEEVTSLVFVRDGELEFRPKIFTIADWSQEGKAERIAELQALHDQGGVAWGAFDGRRFAGILHAELGRRGRHQLHQAQGAPSRLGAGIAGRSARIVAGTGPDDGASSTTRSASSATRSRS